MDRNIINALFKRGLITTVNCDLSKYNTIEEFITKNVSYVGAMPIINEILKKYDGESGKTDEPIVNDSNTITIIDKPTIIEPEIVEITEVPVIDPVVEEPIVEEAVVESEKEITVDETVVEEPVAEDSTETAEVVSEEPAMEETPKKKKSTKKTE